MRLIPLVALLLTACSPTLDRGATTPAGAFFARLTALCGKAYAGRVDTDDQPDGTFANKPLVMHVRDCSADEIRVPFHVGDDRSRTWVVTRTGAGCGSSTIIATATAPRTRSPDMAATPPRRARRVARRFRSTTPRRRCSRARNGSSR